MKSWSFAPVMVIAAPLALTACTQGDQINRDTEPFSGIDESETITLLGNEPFWNISITGENATYTSPEQMDGSEFAVTRFAGNNGLGYSGELDGEAIQIAITPGDCNDSMSDRSFPFTVTIDWAGETLKGCGYTDSQPYTGEAAP